MIISHSILTINESRRRRRRRGRKRRRRRRRKVRRNDGTKEAMDKDGRKENERKE